MVAFIRHVLDLPAPSSGSPPPPIFVMGHSMGGGEVLTLLATPRYADAVVGRVRGWLLEGPFLGFDPRDRPSWLKLHGGKLAGRLLPRMQLVNPIPAEWLTRDPEAQASIRDDPLCHDTGTLEGLAGFMDRTADLAEGRLRLPTGQVKSLWVGHGDHDRTAWFEACRNWFDRYATGVEDRTFKVYEGWLHQLHAEVGRDGFYRDVRDWILARCGDDGKKKEVVEESTITTTTTRSSERESEQAEGASIRKVDSKL